MDTPTPDLSIARGPRLPPPGKAKPAKTRRLPGWGQPAARFVSYPEIKPRATPSRTDRKAWLGPVAVMQE